MGVSRPTMGLVLAVRAAAQDVLEIQEVILSESDFGLVRGDLCPDDSCDSFEVNAGWGGRTIVVRKASQ